MAGTMPEIAAVNTWRIKSVKCIGLTLVQEVSHAINEHVTLCGLEVVLAGQIVLLGHESRDGNGLSDRLAIKLQDWQAGRWNVEACVT
jgi:hypothetical protein